MSLRCTPQRWEAVARDHAALLGADPVKVLAGSREQKCVHARWAAFRVLSARGHSLSSISRASGFDRASVIYAVNAAFRARKNGRVVA